MLRVTKALVLATLGLVLAASGFAVPFAGAVPSVAPTPSAARTITLHGSFSPPAGWGWTANNITEPGPTLTINQGDVITFQLFANDSVSHELVIDLNNNHVPDTGVDGISPTFSSPTTATSWTYTASTAGTFAYFCGIHGYAAQHGTIVIQSTGGGGGGTTTGIDATTLAIGGVVIVVAIVAVAAALMMRRKKP